MCCLFVDQKHIHSYPSNNKVVALNEWCMRRTLFFYVLYLSRTSYSLSPYPCPGITTYSCTIFLNSKKNLCLYLPVMFMYMQKNVCKCVCVCMGKFVEQPKKSFAHGRWLLSSSSSFVVVLCRNAETRQYGEISATHTFLKEHN